MLFDVLKVSTAESRWLLLDFENGEKRRFDMQPLLAQKPWMRIKPADLFAQAFVENGTVAWPGNIDIAPETLYDLSTPVQP